MKPTVEGTDKDKLIGGTKKDDTDKTKGTTILNS